MSLRKRWLVYLAGAIGLCLLPQDVRAEGSELSVGMEGFIDNYEEPDPGVQVDEHARYGALTGAYTYHFPTNHFISGEGRLSYGRNNYKSVSGTAKNIPQYETEARLLGGIRIPIEHSSTVFIPYFGLGSRFYYDNSKGVVTNLGFNGYDRRILQFYAPLGFKIETVDDGWIYKPMLEFDPLILGKVNSRLGNIPGFFNILNTQKRGYGWRGEFTVGQKYDDYSWEAGPFFRYWKIARSETDTDDSGLVWVEPKNTRLQAGATLRFMF